MTPKRSLLFVLAILFIAGCGGSDEPRPDRRPVAEPIDPATAATVVSTVNFEGTAPEPRYIRMDADRTCLELHPDPRETEEVLINENQTLKNVFVYIKEGLEDRAFPVPEETGLLDQEACWYKPRVMGLQIGQTLVIRNSDPTLHNVHAVARENREFNIGQPVKGMETTRTFNRQEVMIPFKCDVHPWMSAYIGVLPHPYFGVTKQEGKVTLANLPPGEYTVAAWHEKYGEQTMKITVGEQETKEISFTYRGDQPS